MEYGAASAEALAHAIVDGVGREMSFRPVAQDGAVRAASVLAALL